MLSSLDTISKRFFLIVFLIGLSLCAYSQYRYFNFYIESRWPDDIKYWFIDNYPYSYFEFGIFIIGFFGSFGRNIFDAVWDNSGAIVMKWIFHGSTR